MWSALATSTFTSADIHRSMISRQGRKTHQLALGNCLQNGQKFNFPIYQHNQQNKLDMNSQEPPVHTLFNVESSQTKENCNDFIEGLLSGNENRGKAKTISIGGFLECCENAKFIVTIAKFITIFKISLDFIACLQNLQPKEKSYLREYSFESVLADTNRKQFYKQFQKTTTPPVSVTSSVEGLPSGILLLVVEHAQNNNQKVQVKILNNENLMHCLLSNVKPGDLLEQVCKFLESKYKKIPIVVCYERAAPKGYTAGLFQALAVKFEQVFHVQVHSEEQLRPLEAIKHEQKITNQVSYTLQGQNCQLRTNYAANNALLARLCEFYNKYRKINNLIDKQIQDSRVGRTVFKENQLCACFYGLYYNFIALSGLQNVENQKIVQQKFLEKFILQKKQNAQKEVVLQKKVINKKLGHFPVKISKGSKVCCVCQNIKKKKSRFKCQKCSETYSRDIALCIDHFKQYHDNITKYIPKGVRKGAYKNEIEMFKQAEEMQHDIIESQASQSKREAQQVLKKWSNQGLRQPQSLRLMMSQTIHYSWLAHGQFLMQIHNQGIGATSEASSYIKKEDQCLVKTLGQQIIS